MQIITINRIVRNTYRFIHIPKNAGTSFINFLEKNSIDYELGTLKNSGGRVGTHRYARDFINRKGDKTFLAVKRNPYTRLVSYFNYLHSEKFNPTNIKWNVTFENFVENKLINPDVNIPSPWILQCEWLLDDNNVLLVDKIFSFENLNNEINDYFQIYDSLEKLNTSRSLNHETYYTDDLKNIVYEHFEKDFEILGYNK